jgi:hypothetical protein
MGYAHGCCPLGNNPKIKKNDNDDECTFIIVYLVEASIKIKKLTTTMSAHSLLSSPWWR